MQAREIFAQLRTQTEGVDPAVLDEVWAALAPVRAEEVLGPWRGADFATGHRNHELLVKMNWYGKTFVDLLDAKPLICRDADGNLFSDDRTMNGEATLWNIEFRGEVTATMVYNAVPVFDHFKRVDANTLMGIMNGKPELVRDGGQLYYFLLERD